MYLVLFVAGDYFTRSVPLVSSSAAQRATQRLSLQHHRPLINPSIRSNQKYCAKSQKSATRTLLIRVRLWGGWSNLKNRVALFSEMSPNSYILEY